MAHQVQIDVDHVDAVGIGTQVVGLPVEADGHGARAERRGLAALPMGYPFQLVHR